MSPDEVFATIVCSIAALLTWAMWFSAMFCVKNWSPRPANRGPLLWAPALCAIGLLGILVTAAASDVVNDSRYIGMYLVMGMAWLGVTHRFSPLAGLSYRFDVLERANPAASAAICGWLLGIMACFAGANVGDGPGWWVVVFCAALSTGGLLACWVTLEMLGRVSESVTVERDLASGIRLGGFLLGTGLILGRAVAGDWISAGATVRDFTAAAWPAALMVVGGAVLEWVYRPTSTRRECPVVLAGVIPAVVYLCAGVTYVFAMGMPE